MKMKKPLNGEKIILLTEKQLEYLKSDRSNMDAADFDYLNLVRREGEDFSLPGKVVFEWDAEGESILQISENSTFDVYVEKTAEKSCEIENCKCNTRYFWRIICKNEVSEVFYFDTADVFPRLIKIDGVSNVRDCGGWKTKSGRRIKQGLLYRGGEMDNHMIITEEGLKTMRENLKIKSVLDLRLDREISGNVYGGNYINISVASYKKWFDTPDSMYKIFKFLSQKENYPIYYHCWGGADRTGTLAFLLGALLGMKYEDLMDDYEITSLSIWGSRSRNQESRFRGLVDTLDEFAGVTLEEKVHNYMLSCEITEEMIGNFKEIMLE